MGDGATPTSEGFREAVFLSDSRVQFRREGRETCSDDVGECVFPRRESQRVRQKCLSCSQLRPLGQGRGSPDQLGVKRRGRWLARGPYTLGMAQELQSFTHPLIRPMNIYCVLCARWWFGSDSTAVDTTKSLPCGVHLQVGQTEGSGAVLRGQLGR